MSTCTVQIIFMNDYCYSYNICFIMVNITIVHIKLVLEFYPPTIRWNPFRFTDIEITFLSLNIYNNYNYVTSRRIRQAFVLYNSRRSNGYERQPIMLFKKKRHRIKSLWIRTKENNKMLLHAIATVIQIPEQLLQEKRKWKKWKSKGLFSKQN
jgi:hypothetical protein